MTHSPYQNKEIIETEHPEHLRETVRRSHRVHQMNVTLEIEGVRRERLVYLKKCKSGALSTVTAKRNDRKKGLCKISAITIKLKAKLLS